MVVCRMGTNPTGAASARPESRSHCDPDLLRGRTRLLTRPDRARLERGGDTNTPGRQGMERTERVSSSRKSRLHRRALRSQRCSPRRSRPSGVEQGTEGAPVATTRVATSRSVSARHTGRAEFSESSSFNAPPDVPGKGWFSGRSQLFDKQIGMPVRCMWGARLRREDSPYGGGKGSRRRGHRIVCAPQQQGPGRPALDTPRTSLHSLFSAGSWADGGCVRSGE
jgi:hypothetical protein